MPAQPPEVQSPDPGSVGAAAQRAPDGAALVDQVVSACRRATDARLLRLAQDALPPVERQARQVLGAALAAAAAHGLRPQDVRQPSGDGPLHADASSRTDPHALLDRCYDFLALHPHPGGRFEHRAGQIEMAHAVLDTLERGDVLVVEAGTGCGKSLAYALPAVVFAWRSGRRVALSTHTRTLQQQLVERELPWLWTRLELASVPRTDGRCGLRFAKLLGRQNYVCHSALERAVQAASTRGGDAALVRLLLELMRRADGSLDELELGIPAAVVDAVRSRRESCTGRACRGDPRCPVYAARERARTSDIVVVNHALLCEDARRDGSLLGECGALVVDEAHALEPVATPALAQRVDVRQADAVVDAVRQLETELHHLPAADVLTLPSGALERLVGAGHDVRRRLIALLEALDAGLPRTAHLRPRQRYRDADEVFAPVEDEVAAVRAALGAGVAAATSVAAACTTAAAMTPAAGSAAALADLVVELLADASGALECVRRAADEDWVYHLDFGSAGGHLDAIVASPLEVGPALQQLVQVPGRAVVYTSATLFVGGDAAYVRRRLGLPAAVRQLAVASPFDYAGQCTVARTASLGDYRDPKFLPGLAVLIEALHHQTQRRMLVLLTSHAMLRALHAELAVRLGDGAPLLAQGITADRATLAARLAATPAGLLLGTASFWEGVDFPGETLEILVLSKLPFAPPDEPLVEARCERLRAHGDDAFGDFILPEAVLRFRQGFGRLIRTRRDRGAVLLVDGRIETRGYGDLFVAALPVRGTSYATPEAMLSHVCEWFATAGE